MEVLQKDHQATRGEGEGEWDGCVCSCRGLVAFGSVRGPAGVGFAHPFQVQALRALGLSA